MKTKIKKSLAVALIAALLMCLISVIGTAAMESTVISSKRTEYHITLKDLASEIRANNAATGKDIAIHFTESSSGEFHFRLFVPKTATAANPAPAIVCCHGGTNMLELQNTMYVELARRGYVVISMDMAGHGETDNSINTDTASSQGMLAAVEFLMSMPEVDENNIGVTGHSFGNSAAVNACAVLNAEGSTQRIKAWVDGDGLRYLDSVTPAIAEGLYLTVGVAKYGETNMPKGYDYKNGAQAKNLIGYFCPSMAGESIEYGTWYSADGIVAQPAEGQTLAADNGFKVIQYPGTHPMWHFSRMGTKIVIDGFYESLGGPAGNSYISSAKQIWPVEVAFELLGLLGFCTLLFPVTAILADTKLFAGIKRKVAAREQLPSLRDASVSIPAIVTIILSIIFAYVSYNKINGIMGNVGPGQSAVMSGSVYPGNGMSTNVVAVWTVACGLFAVAMIVLGYVLTKLLNKKYAGNPFAVAGVESVSQFLLTALYALTVVIVMFIPVFVADKVFHADFRICTLSVQAGALSWLPVIITRYLPLWLAFYIPNAIVIANASYKDMPEWASTAVYAVANCLALIIMLIKQYTTIVSKGTEMPFVAMGGLVAFALIPVLAFAAFSARYIYKKTGNIWAAGFVNGTIFCLMMVWSNSWTTDLIFI